MTHEKESTDTAESREPQNGAAPEPPFDPLGDFLRWRSTTPYRQTTPTIENKLLGAFDEIWAREGEDLVEHLRRHFPWVPDTDVDAFFDAVMVPNQMVVTMFDRYFPVAPPPVPVLDLARALGGTRLRESFRHLRALGVQDAGLWAVLAHLHRITRPVRARRSRHREATDTLALIRRVRPQIWKLYRSVPGDCVNPVTGELEFPSAHFVRELRKGLVSLIWLMYRTERALPPPGKTGSCPTGIDSDRECATLAGLLKKHVTDWGDDRKLQERRLHEMAQTMLKDLRLRRTRQPKEKQTTKKR